MVRHLVTFALRQPPFHPRNGRNWRRTGGMRRALRRGEGFGAITHANFRAERSIVNRQADPVQARESWRFGGFEISLLRGSSAEREEWEKLLLDSGVALPLPHRASWATLQPAVRESWLLCVRDASRRPCGAVAVQVAPSRALPGSQLLRVERFGHGLPAAAHEAVLRVVALLARRHRRVLRLYVESFAIDEGERTTLERHLETLGFTRMLAPRCYEHTLILPLDADEDAIFASLHKTARTNIRAVNKVEVRVLPILHRQWFSRLDVLATETFARTGGRYDRHDWSRIVAICEREPSASRLVGLFREDVEGEGSLIAFAWGCGHGDHAHYSSAGSTREVGRRIPMMYPLLWDLIRWAKGNGARFFDLGGVTAGSLDSADRLGGISDFKRYFSQHAVQVGAEWSYEPRPMQAQAARMVKSASSILSRVLARA
jgi:Acetyltransferase (GNAT) domain